MTAKERIHEDARKKLLDAAEIMFGEADFDSISVREIAEKAGVNVAGISYHFGSKEGLLAKCIERKLSRMIELMRQAEKEVPPEDRLRHIFEVLMERACQKDEGPYLEVNYRVVLHRKKVEVRERFFEEFIEPLNQIFVDAAKSCNLKKNWDFLHPEDLVIVLVAIPKFLKLFGKIFLPKERTVGKTSGQLHEEGGILALKILREMTETE